MKFVVYREKIELTQNNLQAQYFPFLYSTARCHHFVNAGTAI